MPETRSAANDQPVPVTARKADAPATVQTANVNGAGLASISADGGLIQSLYPAPACTRSHNWPVFTAQALRDWRGASTTTSTAYIESGSPWENVLAQSLSGWIWDEFLNTELFTTALEASILAVRWRWVCNSLRPHSAHEGYTPPWNQLNKALSHLHDHPIS